MPHRLAKTLLAAALLALTGTGALAQGMPGPGWGGGWRDRGGEDDDARLPSARQSAQPSKKIDVTAFRSADAAELLGKGRIVVSRLPGDAGDDNDGKLPVYEAAVIDELTRRGYDTATAMDPGQVVEIGVSHSVAVPEEAPHKKMSGAMSTTVSNRGSGFGLALAVDLTKPAKAIIATRLDLRIRDKATGRVLWEGHAEGEAREEDGGINNTQMAARLATALLKKFPDGQVVQPLAAVTP
jgi:ribosomal protein L21E